MIRLQPALSLLMALLLAPLPALGQDETVESLSERAERAFAARRWTTPANDNANSWSDRILALDPDNAYALDLKERIVAQYLNLVEQQLAEDDPAEARSYVERALEVKPGDRTLLKLQERLTHADAAARVRSYDALVDAFNAAERTASAEGWRAFLDRHPDSEFSDYARRQLKSLTVGSLSVSTIRDAEQPADLWLDGEPLGQTPLVVEELAPGRHMLHLERPLHEPLDVETLIEADQRTELQLEMQLVDPVFEARAIHKHGFGGGCTGTLRLRSDRLEFHADDGEHTAIIPWREAGQLDLSHPGKIALNNVRTRRSYKFDLVSASMSGSVITLVSRLSTSF